MLKHANSTKPTSCSEEESILCLFSSFTVDLIATKQHRSCTPVSHSCHWLTRNTGWWKNASNNYSEGRSKKTFQFSRSMFRDILNRIGPFLARGNYDRGSNFPITGASALVISIRIFIYDCRDSRVRSIYSLFALFHNFSKTGLTICYRTACFPAPLQFHFS